MGTLLRVEWLKVKNYRTFWILLVMTILSIPGVHYMLFNLMNNSFPKNKGKNILGSPFALPDGWQTVSWNATVLFILPAILIITLTTNEFTFKTHRQNVIDGWSRGQFIAVKLFELLLLSIVCTITVFLTGLVFGTMVNKLPDGVSLWQNFSFVFYYFISALSYFAIAFVLTMLIKRAGLAIAAFLGYLIVEQIVVGFGRGLYHFDGVNYLPEEVTDRLIPFPYFKAILPADAAAYEHALPWHLVIAVLYLLAYCLFTWRRFTTSDL
jgi:ABC-2 type transport system permease protein